MSEVQKEQRQANDHQLKIYFQKYDRFWRLHKLISLRHLLLNRDEVGASIRLAYEGNGAVDEQYVYGNLTNGILADATSELAMLCEDYFGLLRFTREPFFFVKKTISYSAGRITTLPKSLSDPTDESLHKLFFIPTSDITTAIFANADLATANASVEMLREQIGFLQRSHRIAVDFYQKHKDFHVQYKHGLKLALYGLHGSIPPEEVERRKKELSAPLFSFENKPVDQLGSGSAMFIPDIRFAPVRNNIGRLHKDLDLLHIQFLYDIDINELIAIAKRIVKLNNILISNRMSLIENEHRDRLRFLILESDSDVLQSHAYEFDIPPGYQKPTIFNYQIE
ncbi:hypothetical protein AB4Y36_03535 [Paraburkholderia sp. BR10936]